LIHDVDKKLVEWVSSVAAAVAQDVAVVLDRPRDEAPSRPTVSVYLLEFDHTLPTQRLPRRPLEISLRYLVTAAAADAGQAHGLLESLIFTALERPDLQVDLKPLPAEIWAAFGVAPRPAFTLRHPLVLERPSAAPRVLKPAEINVDLAITLRGVVQTRDGAPVPFARVELPAHASTYTDEKGRFDFGLVPAGADEEPLRIVAKGVEELIPSKRGASGALVVRFDPKEK
jgi:hypothetical protein